MTLLSKPFELRAVTIYPTPRYPTVDGLQRALEDSGGGGHRFGAPMVTSVVVASLSGVGCSRAPASPSTEQPSSTVLVPIEPTAVATAPEVPEEKPAPRPPVDLKNVFSWEASGLPIEWHPYGTGEPSRLSEEKARAVIESVFAEAGVQLAKEVPFRRPGIAVELDGYDAARRIGYEWVTWSDLEDPTGFRGKKDGQDGNDFGKMISHEEMKGIQALEGEGREHVVIVSYQDDRFSYPSWGSPDGGPGPESMEINLRAAVKEYVMWLKAQGAL